MQATQSRHQHPPNGPPPPSPPLDSQPPLSQEPPLPPPPSPWARRTPPGRDGSMCYFDQTRWSCGYWKWGNFRQQCTKEYRTGETCGLKLVYDTALLPGLCKLCDTVDKKRRRVAKMREDMARWEREGNRRATMEKTRRDIAVLEGQVQELCVTHWERTQRLV
ncbi:hypothetical protein P8C59_009024 [Phyllachora maydis]|uniref:Uncharacterized protein n=1 Tax=Phyllachora maydis TaxID=1825666 RepID=A0AAD9MHS0_9PEZI|nr:hypothetical protein P8C59_009024 [Phyllachora maydis]